MADVWTTPATFSVGEVLSAAKMNTNVRDNTEALLNAVNGDVSADADTKHSHKVGTFASRPAASKAGRLYYASDYDALFHDTGAVWKHLTGRGAYDDFERANSTTLGSANSGHPWTESVADQEINSNALRAVSLASGISIATVDTGGLIESGQYMMGFTTGATQASINIGCVLKYVNSTTHLWVQLHATLGLRIMVGSSPLTSYAYAPAASTFHTMLITLTGSYVTAQLMHTTAFVAHVTAGSTANIVTPYVTATRVGCLFGTAAHDRVEAFAFKPN